MKRLFPLLLVFALSGCAGLTSDHSAVNQMISEQNTQRFKAFSEGMAGCGNNAACQVGLAMGFSANLGQQALFKPETTTDLLHAFLPYATLGVDVARLWRTSYSGDAAGFVITGDNNQISGVANKLSADNQSGVNASFEATPSVDHYVYTQDRTTDSANGTTDNSSELAPEVEEPVVE